MRPSSYFPNYLNPFGNHVASTEPGEGRTAERVSAQDHGPPTVPAHAHAPSRTAASHPTLAAYLAARSRSQAEGNARSHVFGLQEFRDALLKFDIHVPARKDETKPWERLTSENSGPGFVTMFRGDEKPRSRFLSKLAHEKGEEVSNAAVARAQASGETSTLFAVHSLSSTKSPFISVTSSQAEAEAKARGESGQQKGYVTKFGLPEEQVHVNFENFNTREREYLVATRIAMKFIQGQYPVKPDSSQGET